MFDYLRWRRKRWWQSLPWKNAIRVAQRELSQFRKELPTDTKWGSVLVEDRIVSYLPTIVRNHLFFVPEDFGLTIFHGKENEDWLKDELSSFNINWICLTNKINGANDVNRLMLEPWFYECIPYEKCIVFQHDTLLCKSFSPVFMNYDWIGAPWIYGERADYLGGNGGLSLRNVSVIYGLLPEDSEEVLSEGIWEDVYFSQKIAEAGGRIAPREVAQQFSVEALYYSMPFGVHNCWTHLPYSMTKSILSQIEYH